MTKILTCRDVGVDCDFVAEGETVEEVMEKTRNHAREGHGFADIPAEMIDKVKAAIHDKDTKAA
jgi:predicted small metal-binding protein